MNRRRFVAGTLGAAVALELAGARVAWSAAAGPRYGNLLVLVELKGGNDGLNTLVPFADPAYATLRPKLKLERDALVQLSDRVGLHPALAPLKAIWDARELAVVQGVGYAEPNLSHFRSIEIWDTASESDAYLPTGWLARTFDHAPAPQAFAAQGVVVASNALGPLSGAARTIALADTDAFKRQARLAAAEGTSGNRSLAHIRRVEADIVHAAQGLTTRRSFTTSFPSTPFGSAIRVACEAIANPAGIAAVRVTLDGFDTHAGQAATHARLLGQLADGLAALKSALIELGRWNETLVLSYAEFGRRPKENLSAGTDHGTCNVHFALGGRVAGGLYGETPSLSRLSGEGNLPHKVDFRSVYATVLERWWGLDSRSVLERRFETLPLLRA